MLSETGSSMDTVLRIVTKRGR